MRNFVLVGVSVLLISLTFVITLGLWPVAVFWANVGLFLIALVSVLVLVVFVPYWLINFLHNSLGFGLGVSLFASISLSIFCYVVTSFWYDLLGKVSLLHEGVWDISIASPVASGVVTGLGVVLGVFNAAKYALNQGK